MPDDHEVPRQYCFLKVTHLFKEEPSCQALGHKDEKAWINIGLSHFLVVQTTSEKKYLSDLCFWQLHSTLRENFEIIAAHNL